MSQTRHSVRAKILMDCPSDNKATEWAIDSGRHLAPSKSKYLTNLLMSPSRLSFDVVKQQIPEFFIVLFIRCDDHARGCGDGGGGKMLRVTIATYRL